MEFFFEVFLCSNAEYVCYCAESKERASRNTPLSCECQSLSKDPHDY